MEATIKYEHCDEMYAEEQHDSATAIPAVQGQYYGQRSAVAQQQQQQLHSHQQSHQRQVAQMTQPIHAHQAHSQSHASHHRPSHVEHIRQRPTHPDFAHLRQNSALAQTRPVNTEHLQSRQSNADHLLTRQTHSEHNHGHRQSHSQLAQIRPSAHATQHPQYPSHHIPLKRAYHDMENVFSTGAIASTQSAIGTSTLSTEGNSFYSGQGMINVAPHTQNLDIFSQAYANYEASAAGAGLATAPDGKSPKRYKKGDASLLFSPPFFKILPLPYQLAGMVSPNHKDAIAAQCYACGRIVRGNKSISSNFIKHMKRSHPEISKIYDTYKIFRIKAGIMPNIGPLLDMKSDKMAGEEPNAVPEDNGDSNEESSPYFDPTSLLDVAEMIEEDNHSDNSENAEDSMPSAEASESNELPKSSEPKIGSDIPAKMLDAISKLLDSKLKQFVQQTDLPAMVGNIKEDVKEAPKKESSAMGSSETSTVNHLKDEVEQLKRECIALRTAVHQSQASKIKLQQELQTVDKMFYQKKLIIRHLKTKDGEKPLETVQKLFKEKMGLEDIEIVNVSIIPSTKAPSSSSLDHDKECVIVELPNGKSCKAILRGTHKLKGTGIFIEPEISPFQRKRKNKLMVLRKELLRRKPELKVLVLNTTLVVDGKKFYWDDVEGLCHSSNSEALELSGIEYIKSLTGLDMEEFVTVLKNYEVSLKE